jgi:formylglycine-generating enzyme required for sulfatase activity
LIYPSHWDYDHNWGLNYQQGKWVAVQGMDNHPVIYVSWYGATEFAASLGGRLPTEAEWDYACRANTNTPYYFGTCLLNIHANYDWPYPYNMCYNTNNFAPRKTQKVGSYPPNGFGLYDMHGNVWEWCSDWYGPYPQIAETDPQGPEIGPFRVCRGGGWSNIAKSCRSAMRYPRPMEQARTLGFRVVIPQYHTL